MVLGNNNLSSLAERTLWRADLVIANNNEKLVTSVLPKILFALNDFFRPSHATLTIVPRVARRAQLSRCGRTSINRMYGWAAFVSRNCVEAYVKIFVIAASNKRRFVM